MALRLGKGPEPLLIGRADGLHVQVQPHGGLGRFEHNWTMLNLLPGNPLEPGLQNLYLRVYHRTGIEALPLLTTCTAFAAAGDRFTARGERLGFAWTCSLTLDPARNAWLWTIDARGSGTLDVVYAQDIGLGDRGHVLNNESFVSQYVDFTALTDAAHGWAVCCRQNLSQGGRHPWLLLGSPDRVAGFLTDGMNFFGPEYRLTGQPQALRLKTFPNRVQQQELGLVALVTRKRRVVRGNAARFRFFGQFLPDHAEPSGANDLACLPDLTRWADALPVEPAPAPERVPVRTLFATASLAPAANPTAADLATWFPYPHRQVEHHTRCTRGDGVLPSPRTPLQRATGPFPGGVAESAGANTTDLIHSDAAPAHSATPEKGGSATRQGFQGMGGHHPLTAVGEGLSFFTETATHVVVRGKEGLVERAHAHILQTGIAAVVDDRIMSSTCFMFGAFHSHITFGNTRFNKLLGMPRGQLNLTRAVGQRIFVRTASGEWQLLAVPSAFAMDLNRCRWFYRLPERTVTVTAWSDPNAPMLGLAITVDGLSAELLLSHLLCVDVAEYDSVPEVTREANGDILVRPDRQSEFGRRYPDRQFRLRSPQPAVIAEVGGDELLYTDGKARQNPCLVLRTRPVTQFRLDIIGEDGATDGSRLESTGVDWNRLKSNPSKSAPGRPATPEAARRPEAATTAYAEQASRYRAGLTLGGTALAEELNDILPWFVQNAMVHYLTPHGLEQYGGAAWGTRDVCQGPLELLLALGHDAAARAVIRRVFAAQNPDGTWPQWFMFDAYETIRAGDSHGDVILWPLKALVEYLEATADSGILNEPIPYPGTGPDTPGPEPLLRHVERQIARIRRNWVPDTALIAFGDGDWDDSLQPADPAFKQRLISSWTVELNYQFFARGAEAFRRAGLPGLAAGLAADAERIRTDFNRILLPDGVVAGFVLRRDDGSCEPMLHPADRRTGIQYRLLPMTRAMIGGIFTAEQARLHLHLIRQHLLAADGARLMDTPPRYNGGRQVHFQRAETSTYFGREIGLMYTHAHIRYIEALGRLGEGDALGEALRRMLPINLGDAVPTALPRQRNCYFTSSDAAFDTRYQACRDFRQVFTGSVAFRGGWRVYSSGPGIFVNQVMSTLLGLRRRYDMLVIDPVLPAGSDGLTARLTWAGRFAEFAFRRGAAAGGGVCGLRINGQPLTLEREAHPYRPGGLLLPKAVWQNFPAPDPLAVEIDCG